MATYLDAARYIMDLREGGFVSVISPQIINVSAISVMLRRFEYKAVKIFVTYLLFFRFFGLVLYRLVFISLFSIYLFSLFLSFYFFQSFTFSGTYFFFSFHFFGLVIYSIVFISLFSIYLFRLFVFFHFFSLSHSLVLLFLLYNCFLFYFSFLCFSGVWGMMNRSFYLFLYLVYWCSCISLVFHSLSFSSSHSITVFNTLSSTSLRLRWLEDAE